MSQSEFLSVVAYFIDEINVLILPCFERWIQLTALLRHRQSQFNIVNHRNDLIMT